MHKKNYKLVKSKKIKNKWLCRKNTTLYYIEYVYKFDKI